MAQRSRQQFWRRARRWTLGLLGLWLAVNLAVPWFARDLNRWQVFGFPAGYWLAAEGALLIYLLIIVAYVLVMDRLEAALLRGEAGAQTTGEAAAPATGTDAP